MSNIPLISIILPVYNDERNIKRCIQSILNQSFENFVLIIINDGSTDNSLNVINTFKDKRIILISQNNMGVSAARNKGLSLLKTSYVTFVDSDDYVEKNYLLNMLKDIKENKSDLSVTGINYIDGDNTLSFSSKYKKQVISSSLFIKNIFDNEGPKGYLWNKLWKTNVIKKNKLHFDTKVSMAEDLLFCVQYTKLIDKVSISNKHDYNHVLNPNSLSSSIELSNKDKKYIKVFMQWISVLERIRKMIPVENIDAQRKVESDIVSTDIYFLRNIYVKNNENEELKNIVKCNIYHYKDSFFCDEEVKNKKKMSYFLVLYFPFLVKMIDRLSQWKIK